MHKISRLDVMIAYSCNISCQGCISISDRKRSGVEPLENLLQDLQRWQDYLEPEVTTIFGGEPCLHPKLIELAQAIRRTWPNTVIRLITNGYLLDNFDSSHWFELGALEIQISVHRKDHESVINNKIKKILQQRHPWTVCQHSQQNHHKQIQWQHNQVTIYKSIFKDFVVPYRTVNHKIAPWYSDPAAAHKICGAPDTPVLYKGKLYKCPAVANAIDLAEQNWFDYQAVDIDGDIESFVQGIGRPETVCAQCPDQQQAVIIDHFDIKNVTVKQKNIN
jgi:hypothetical protein